MIYRLDLVQEDAALFRSICGPNDINLSAIEERFSIRIYPRGNELSLEGKDSDILQRALAVLERLSEYAQKYSAVSADYLKSLLSVENSASVAEEAFNNMEEAQIHIPGAYASVFPRSRNQARFIRAMRTHDISFCTGPAGTGKSYLAVAEALKELFSRRRRKILLARPIVEAGESLGFLPGDLSQMVHPYLRPLYDAMEALLPWQKILKKEEERAIEVVPLAYMRGRSFNDAIIILDEAQNTTKEQMKLFLTRIGEGAKAIITGDITQIDLPKKEESGLVHAMQMLIGIPGIARIELGYGDIVRNPLVRKILEAYEKEES